MTQLAIVASNEFNGAHNNQMRSSKPSAVVIPLRAEMPNNNDAPGPGLSVEQVIRFASDVASVKAGLDHVLSLQQETNSTVKGGFARSDGQMSEIKDITLQNRADIVDLKKNDDAFSDISVKQSARLTRLENFRLQAITVGGVLTSLFVFLAWLVERAEPFFVHH